MFKITEERQKAKAEKLERKKIQLKQCRMHRVKIKYRDPMIKGEKMEMRKILMKKIH